MTSSHFAPRDSEGTGTISTTSLEFRRRFYKAGTEYVKVHTRLDYNAKALTARGKSGDRTAHAMVLYRKMKEGKLQRESVEAVQRDYAREFEQFKREEQQ